jgi:mono/diheme cytochrome c family protein/glucose/arabinose dehydrogenase
MRDTLAAALLLAGGLWAQHGDKPGEAQADLPADLAVPPAIVRAPADELATIRLQPGYRLELAAAEPLIGDPVACAFDAAGRAWVVEMRGFMRDVDASAELEPSGRIVVLEDTDGDGRFDRSTVFLDHLVLPRAVLPMRGGALVIAPPNLLWAADADGDLRCEHTEIVAGGFEAGTNNPEHAGNGLLFGLDNLVHLADHPFAFARAGNAFTAVPTGGGGQWGLSQDDQGRLYFDYNEDWLRCDLLPSTAAPRSAHLGALVGTNVRLCADTAVFPIGITPGVNRGYRPGILKDWKLADHTAACAPWFYRGDLLPELAGSVFACDPAAHVVRRFLLSDAAVPTARNAYAAAEFIASTDERFRPVHLTAGPDGALWITDMYRGVIQHKNFVTTWLRRQILARGLEQPLGLGRLWRVVRADGKAPPLRAVAGKGTQQLVAALADIDGWRRDQAQQLLVERGDRAALPLLRALLRTEASPWPARVRALAVLAGLGDLQREDVVAGLYDPAPEVRTQALRLAPPFLRRGGSILPTLCELCCARTAAERWALALALAEVPDATALPLFAALAAHAADDEILRAAFANAAVGRELPLLRHLLALPSPPPPLLSLLARSLVVRRDAGLQVQLFDLAAAQPDTARVQALLTGAAQALPTGEARIGWFRLTSTPQALVAVQRLGDGAIAATAQRLLAAVALEPEAVAAALPPADLARILSGARTYGLVCAACHQPSGNGMAGLAPPLRDSEWVTGKPSRLLRIALFGVRGAITAAGVGHDGEMPAQSTLSDADVADVLSYVRNAFGHRGSLLTAGEAAAVRAAEKNRRDTFTVAELLAID